MNKFYEIKNNFGIKKTGFTFIGFLVLFLCLVPITATAAPYAYVAGGEGCAIDTATDTIVARFGLSQTDEVATSPDGSNVYFCGLTGENRSTVTTINTLTNTATGNISVNGYFEMGMVVSPDGRHLYLSIDYPSSSSKIDVIDLTSNTVRNFSISGMYIPNFLTISPDGRRLYVSGCDQNYVGYVYVIDTTTNRLITRVRLNYFPWGISLAPDGKILYDVTDRDVSVISTITNTVMHRIVGLDSFKSQLAFNPAGTKVYVTGRNGVSIIDTHTYTVSTLPLGVLCNDVAVTSDGAKLYTANDNGTVSIINTATNTVNHIINVGGEPNSIAFGGSILRVRLPIAAFSSSILRGTAPLTVKFTDQSKGTIDTYLWDFGDKTKASQDRNPVHQFAKPGIYSVTLTVSNKAGSNTLKKSNYITVTK